MTSVSNKRRHIWYQGYDAVPACTPAYGDNIHEPLLFQPIQSEIVRVSIHIRQCVLDLKFLNRIPKLILVFGSFSTEFVLQNFVLQNSFCRISSSSFCRTCSAEFWLAEFCLAELVLQDSSSFSAKFVLQNSDLGFRPVAVFQSVLSLGPPQPDWSYLRRVASFYTRRRGWCCR